MGRLRRSSCGRLWTRLLLHSANGRIGLQSNRAFVLPDEQDQVNEKLRFGIDYLAGGEETMSDFERNKQLSMP